VSITFVSVSAGGWHQPSGLAVVERLAVPTSAAYTYIPDPPATSPHRYRAQVPRPVELAEQRQDARVEYHVRYLQRHGPPTRIGRLGSIIARIVSEIAGDVVLLLDCTAIGAPGYKRLAQAAADARDGIPVMGVLVSGAAGGTSRTGDGLRVAPRQHLIVELQSLFDSGRLKVASALPLAATLEGELLAFQQKPPRIDPSSLDGWREGQYDDLVLATALPVWAGERHLYSPDHIVLPEPAPLSRG